MRARRMTFPVWGLAMVLTGLPGPASATGAVTNALTVTLNGDGSGTVTSSPPGIDCGFDCEESYESGTEVTLTATPAANATFVGWSGACGGTGECVVTMTADTEVVATFDAFVLTATIIGDGSGEVVSSPPGIDCSPGGYNCSEPYAPGTQVTLTATPAERSAFTGWSGACAGTDACEVTVTGDLTVTASFDTSRLYVTKAGDGFGTITSSPTGIDCPGDCLEKYLPGTQVTLTASPGAKAVFAGWSGECEGTGSCVVTMDTERSVTATFDTSFLTVSRDGLGAGTVTSEPPGINCGLDCGEAYLPAATEVTLTATPQAGSSFAGWTGDCAGTGTCVLTMDVDRAVAATFNPPGVAGKIVYECVSDICLMDEDGSNKINLTNSMGVQDYEPELSADGTKIVFRSNGYLTDNADRNYEIVTMNIDGSEVYQVTTTPGGQDPQHNYEPAWSPDGTKIAFSSHRGFPTARQIFTINPDGTGETMLTDPSDYVRRLSPAWSPDGSVIAFTWTLGQGDIYVMNPDGTNQVNLTPGTQGWDDVDPAWSPDGTRIAYTSDQYYDPLTFNTDIFVRNADGSGKVRVTDDIHIDNSPTWSPDGAEIAFSSTRGGNYDIWAVAAPARGLQTGSPDAPTEPGLRQVTTSPGADLDPYWGGEESTFMLRVTKVGSGQGTVRSKSPGGIKCGADCSEEYAAGTIVRVVARPLAGSTFKGWSGACTGTGACQLTMDSAKTVKARFNTVAFAGLLDSS